ncbi:hypothetical protein ONS95_005492 [Cadophora gregata]|uniref:uncharacterized protein n=1 Tax=Cadophora gregata TaxID=51156 RepID=UPI0026DB93A4|nr:uncharacterized protein ONS95_005492 [Cadophora gregata]KAK0103471.1 hypothetical protein ONS95_005492 [Cadophora gregata]KAK0107662.1 hypothetical protein ONS96_003462 [Cadophora gregata f. sp. sojae]
MGLLDLHWKGKSKAAPSSTTNSITSIFTRTQQPTPTALERVQTTYLSIPQASTSGSSSRSRYPQPEYSEPETIKTHWKSHRDEKLMYRSMRCEHQISCGLNTSECCACLDRRPLKRDYFIYKDGRGLVAEGPRWVDYCPGCKAYWAKRQGKGIPDPSSPSKASAGESSRAVVPSSSSRSETTRRIPEQQQQPQSQGELNDPPPPYSSALSDGWEILPRYQEADQEYGHQT